MNEDMRKLVYSTGNVNINGLVQNCIMIPPKYSFDNIHKKTLYLGLNNVTGIMMLRRFTYNNDTYIYPCYFLEHPSATRGTLAVSCNRQESQICMHNCTCKYVRNINKLEICIHVHLSLLTTLLDK